VPCAGDRARHRSGSPRRAAAPLREGDIKFIQVPEVRREDIVLPAALLERIGRHTLGFARHREVLRASKLAGPDAPINLHVFSRGCPEIDRMLQFRDWLRIHDADRELYERTKRELARRDWTYTQQYADAKTAVVEEILARARR